MGLAEEVPGGLRALGFIARGKENSSPEGFFADYCRAVIRHTTEVNAAPVYQGRLRSYFQRMALLEACGRRERGGLTITLSVGDRESQRVAEKVSNLLGWKARTFQRQMVLEVADKTSQSKRKETATALDVDELRMQAALQAGKPFRLDIRYEEARLLLGEEAWRAAFYPKEKLPGGFAEAVARYPRLAKLYVGLSTLDDQARGALLGAVGLKEAGQKYTDLLYQHASSLAVLGGRASVPGGERAESIWSKLVGADPGPPGPFFRALLEKDQGRLLAFFTPLSRFDSAHQRYCTRTPARTEKLCELFRQVPEVQTFTVNLAKEVSFVEFLRTVPLDAEGRIRFPGGVGAWGAVEPEEDVLARLARSRHRAHNENRAVLDAVVAVGRIDAHRAEGLSEASVRLLARGFWDFSGAYPYFSLLTGLGDAEFQQFFTMAEKLRGRRPEQLNIVMGQWHALVAILCRAQEAGAMDAKQTARLFGLLCGRFAEAASLGDFTRASLDLVGKILPESSDPDQAIERLLLGSSPRAGKYRQVLELQAVPRLGVVLERNEAALAKLPLVEIPKTVKLTLKEREMLETLVVGRRHQTKDVETELGPQVTLALAGILYAYYLDPSDLLVAEDPLFLRKHRFLPSRELFGRSEFYPNSEAAGSYLGGGFADMGIAAGQVAVAGAKQSETPSEVVFAAQMGSLRITDWSRLGDTEQRTVGRKVGAAREWITEAARQPAVRAELAEASLGLLSFARRARLWQALEAQDWKSVWAAVTLSDLYHLGDRKSGDGARVDLLGGSLSHLFSCSHPHLMAPAPYEEYENQLAPGKIAERTAELKLYLAEYLDRKKMPAAALAKIAEPVAREILRDLPMTDMRDWRSVQAAFSGIADEMIESALREP